MLVRRIACVCLILAIGCGDDAPSQPSPLIPGPLEVPAVIDAAPEPVVTDFAGGDDEAAALAELDAVPAWTAVVDRDRYLARRAAAGAVHGRLVEVEDQRWLIDDTEGGGSLGIRVTLPPGAEVEPGDRLLLHGAWTTDDANRWLWQVARVERLAPATTAPPDFDPTRELETEPAPETAVPVSAAEGAGDILFEVVGSPLRPGDGWDIIDPDSKTEEPAAILLLPGERHPYGAQDLTSPDEHWTLKQGTTYVVTVDRFRRRGTRPPTLRATAAPRIVE
jgi:hypothetical protein